MFDFAIPFISGQAVVSAAYWFISIFVLLFFAGKLWRAEQPYLQHTFTFALISTIYMSIVFWKMLQTSGNPLFWWEMFAVIFFGLISFGLYTFGRSAE